MLRNFRSSLKIFKSFKQFIKQDILQSLPTRPPTYTPPPTPFPLNWNNTRIGILRLLYQDVLVLDFLGAPCMISGSSSQLAEIIHLSTWVVQGKIKHKLYVTVQKKLGHHLIHKSLILNLFLWKKNYNHQPNT